METKLLLKRFARSIAAGPVELPVSGRVFPVPTKGSVKNLPRFLGIPQRSFGAVRESACRIGITGVINSVPIFVF